MLDIAIDKESKTCKVTFTHDIDLTHALRTEIPKDGNGKPQGPERNVVADDEVERHIIREAAEDFAKGTQEWMENELKNQQAKDDAHAAAVAALQAEHSAALAAKDGQYSALQASAAQTIAEMGAELKATAESLANTEAAWSQASATVELLKQGNESRDAKLAEMQAFVDACGGSDYAKKMAAEAKRQAILRQMEEAKLAEQRAAEELAKLEVKP